MRSELRQAAAACRSAFMGVAALSGAVNVLYLTGSVYMLEVYDRVVPSRSIPTLIGISVIAAVLYAFQGLLDIARNRILTRVGASLDARISGRIFDAVARLPLRSGIQMDGLAPLRDLDQVRSFVSGNGPPAFFDLPWMPLYLAVCFAFHPVIGVVAASGAAALFLLAIATEIASRKPASIVASSAGHRFAQAEAARSNSETIRALGMGVRMTERWAEANDAHRSAQQSAADVTTGLGGLAKVLRLMLQSSVLGVGAWLVINQEASAGIIIASSILTSRALAPVEAAIANWKGFVAARQSWRRLSELLSQFPEPGRNVELPRPCRQLSIHNASASPPNAQKLVVRDATFNVLAGHALGVIGPSASGKSSLVRLIANVWSPVGGDIRLDGATLDQWNPLTLGQYLGYLPQDVRLFEGTIGENICRFDSLAKSDDIIAAAQLAGVHELILALPDGYETNAGNGGGSLSAGQRQRIALARALYGNPFLVVLDEPNSNLDAEGEKALTEAILKIRNRDGIVVVVAHRPSALAACDLVLVMSEGRVQHFGAKDEILARVLQSTPNVVHLHQPHGRPVQAEPQANEATASPN